jgi:beta-glucosidase
VFVASPAGPLARPPLELRAFTKLRLAPGERRPVTLGLDARAFAAYDPLIPGWRVEPGRHRIVVASSGRPVRETSIDLPVPVTLPVR